MHPCSFVEAKGSCRRHGIAFGELTSVNSNNNTTESLTDRKTLLSFEGNSTVTA